MISSDDQSFSPLDGYPACWFDSLSTFVNDQHVKEIIIELCDNEFAKGLVGCRGEGAADYVCIAEHLINLSKLELSKLFTHLLKFCENFKLLRLCLSFCKLS